jgi:PmbA protein
VIARLLERAAARAEAADVRVATDDTLVLTLADDAVTSAAALAEQGTCLRVRHEGRVGRAATSMRDIEGLVERALASAAVGEPLPLLLPGPSPLPPVLVHDAAAAALGVDALAKLGGRLASRVRRDGRRVTVHLERSAGSVRIGNTRGVDAGYDASLVALELTVVRTADGVMATRHVAAVDVPDDLVLDALAADIERQLEWARSSASTPTVPGAALLMPPAVRGLLAPVLDALVIRGEPSPMSPLVDGLDEPILHPSLTLRDDPWLELRPGSRAIDDDGVTTWPQLLIEEGAVRHCAVDLETGAAVHRPATGHGRRTTFGRPHAGFSNLLLAPGEAALAELLAAVGDGLLVERLAGVSGIGRSGAFHLPVALGYRVQGGEVSGRVEGAVLAGNVFDALGAVGGVGRERQWVGSCFLPALVVEGLSVAGD